MQPRSRRAVIVLDALGLAALAALFVLWCVRTPGLSVPGGIAAGCSAALFAAVGLRFVPAWVHFWQREGDAPAAVPAAEPAHMGSRIFAALLALDLVLLLLTWSVRALAGQPETLAQALEFWRCTDSRHYLDIARDGYIAAMEAKDIGLVSMHLGGGRATKEDVIDLSVGVVLAAKDGAYLHTGDTLATIHAKTEADAAAAEEELLKCYTFSDEAPVRPPFIRGVVT